jgi:hypothetical protein
MHHFSIIISKYSLPEGAGFGIVSKPELHGAQEENDPGRALQFNITLELGGRT